MVQRITLDVIGVIHSCYREKFGIPRQPGLIGVETATLELLPPYNRPEAVRGLEGFSHIWLSFIFHGVEAGKWSPTVRPPRLGGNERVGVFASRSTHRPNPLGLSVVELGDIEVSGAGVRIHLIGADLLDGTPVVDIKPYIPYVDSLPEAAAGFAREGPEKTLEVIFSVQADEQLQHYGVEYPQLRQLISESLAYDPRPAYRAARGNQHRGGVRLYEFDVCFEVQGERLEVLSVEREQGDSQA